MRTDRRLWIMICFLAKATALVVTVPPCQVSAMQIYPVVNVKIAASGQERAKSIVIKRQDRVKLIAKIGDVTVTASGEAMQDGRVGETIRVMNAESKAIVAGRVLRANEVEITE